MLLGSVGWDITIESGELGYPETSNRINIPLLVWEYSGDSNDSFIFGPQAYLVDYC